MPALHGMKPPQRSLDTDKTLPKAARLIGNIVRRANKPITQEQIIRKTGYCRNTVSPVLRLLLAKKLIRLHYHAGHRIANRYSAPLPVCPLPPGSPIHLYYIPHDPILDGFKKREWRISIRI